MVAKQGGGARTRRPEAQVRLTPKLLHVLAQLEGRPPLFAREIAPLLGLGPYAAWKLLKRLQESGLMTVQAAVRCRSDLVRCVSYVRVAWDSPQAVAALENRLASEPTVTTLDRIGGVEDLRITSVHKTHEAATSWFHALTRDPVVLSGELQFARVVIERPLYAQALLACLERTAQSRPTPNAE